VTAHALNCMRLQMRNWKVTALVPCLDEKDRIGDVLKVLINSANIDDILVVDDGSTDGTSGAVKKFKSVKLLRLEKNIGKGGAIKKGLKQVTSEVTLLIDVDLKGLTNEKIGSMVTPVTNEGYDVCIGVLKRGPNWFQYLRKNVLPLMSGERAIKTKILNKILENSLAQEWGIEFYMNLFIKKKKLKLKKIDLVGVDDIRHFRKKGFKVYFKRLLFFWIINIKLFWLSLVWQEAD